MKLPIDLKAVIEAATDIESARNTPVSVSALIHDSAPGDVAAHVRSAFVGAGAHARVTVGYFAGPAFSPYEGDDMAVVVAGFSEEVGRRAAEIRAAGVPVMVVTSMPRLVADMAVAYDNPIPEGDLVAPEGVAGCDAESDAACESGGVAGANAQPPEDPRRSDSHRCRRSGSARSPDGRAGRGGVPREAPCPRAVVPVRAQAALARGRERDVASECWHRPRAFHSWRRHAADDAQPGEDAAPDRRRIRRTHERCTREGTRRHRRRRLRRVAASPARLRARCPPSAGP